MRSSSASVSAAPLPPAVLHSAATRDPLIRRIWPMAAMGFGLALTAAWMSLLGYFLGYALVRLAQLTF